MELPETLLLSLLVVPVTLLLGRTLITGFLTMRAMAVTPLVSRWLSRWVKARDYTYDEFFQADGVGQSWVETRRQALERLADRFRFDCPKSLAWGNAVRESFSDLRFTDANRVPFPFVQVMREKFNLASVMTASDGPRLRDLDGRWSLDVSGSYGLNVAGFDRYKHWIENGWNKVKDLGPVLGPLHPVVAENITMLRAVSGLDDVSFHMS